MKRDTANICQKVNKKFFILWKLKQFGLKQEELLTAWKVLLRPISGICCSPVAFWADKMWLRET